MADEIDSIPAISPDPDEMDSYLRSARAEAPKQSNFNGLLVFVIVLMAIIMGVGGYTLYEVQQKLDQSNLLLAQGQENVKELDDRLAATGTDVSKTLQDMQREIKENFKQIDLLWGHAYRTNKPNIEKNAKAIARISGEVNKELKTLAQTVHGIEARFNTLSTEMLRLKQDVQGDNEDMTTQVALMRGQTQDQAVIVEGNRRTIASLSEQLTDAQEAIDVIDRYRRQINQRLVDLQEQLQDQAAP